MKPPRIPPMVTDIVSTALSCFDGMVFKDLASCPSCGGVVQGHDTKTKKFVVLRQEQGQRVISVSVKRFYCRSCGNLCYADEPFYPGSRIGSPVIDLFAALSTVMPQSRAARMIGAMGITVDRTTWKHYSDRLSIPVPVVDLFGVRLPLSLVKLSELAATTGESGRPDPADVLAVCGSPSTGKK